MLLRNLKTRQLLAKYEGHLYPVAHLSFAQSSYIFVTSANSECLLWNPREQLKIAGSPAVAEISQPEKILDLASSELITQVAVKEIGEGATYMVAVSSDSATSVFITKGSNGG